VETEQDVAESDYEADTPEYIDPDVGIDEDE
jgi:hypothetical protein